MFLYLKHQHKLCCAGSSKLEYFRKKGNFTLSYKPFLNRETTSLLYSKQASQCWCVS